MTQYINVETLYELEDKLNHMGYELEVCFRESLLEFGECMAYRKYDLQANVVEFKEGKGFKMYTWNAA